MKRLLASTALAALIALPAFARGGSPIFSDEKQEKPIASENGYFVASPASFWCQASSDRRSITAHPTMPRISGRSMT